MRYNIYTDGAGKTIVTSTYAGKTVRGISKCAPEDTYSEEIGVELAKARCDAKVAMKRHENAKKKYDEAARNWHKATSNLDNMCEYLRDSYEQWLEAYARVELLQKERH